MTKRFLPTADRLRLFSAVTESGCIEFTGHRLNGYGRMKVSGRMVLAHRLAWELANDRPIPIGLCVLHRCDNPACVNPDHLWIGDNAANVADRVAKGRTASTTGSANGSAKLTEGDIPLIVLMPGTHQQVAEKFGVSKSLVGAIRQKKAWKQMWAAIELAWASLTAGEKRAYLQQATQEGDNE